MINLLYYALLAAAYVLFIKYAFWIAFPFIASLVVAMALQRPIKFLAKKTKTREKFWAILLVVLILLILAGVLIFAGYKIGVEFKGLMSYLSSKMADYPVFIQSVKTRVFRIVNKLPKAVILSVKDALLDVFDKLQSLGSEEKLQTAQAAVDSASSSSFDLSFLATPLSGLVSTAKKIPAILTAFLMGIISCFFLTSDYDNFIDLIKRNVSDSTRELLSKTKSVTINTLGKYVKSYAMILFITFVEITVGLSVLSLLGLYEGGYVLAIGIGTAVLDILPVFGTGTVFIPWVIISLFSHKIGLGIGLLVVYIIITIARQVLEPRLVSTNVGMHPVITLMAMYVGIQLFGVMGILILPVSLVIVKTLNSEGIIKLWGSRC